jgi:hypothetical protein
VISKTYEISTPRIREVGLSLDAATRTFAVGALRTHGQHINADEVPPRWDFVSPNSGDRDVRLPASLASIQQTRFSLQRAPSGWAASKEAGRIAVLGLKRWRTRPPGDIWEASAKFRVLSASGSQPTALDPSGRIVDVLVRCRLLESENYPSLAPLTFMAVSRVDPCGVLSDQSAFTSRSR